MKFSNSKDDIHKYLEVLPAGGAPTSRAVRRFQSQASRSAAASEGDRPVAAQYPAIRSSQFAGLGGRMIEAK